MMNEQLPLKRKYEHEVGNKEEEEEGEEEEDISEDEIDEFDEESSKPTRSISAGELRQKLKTPECIDCLKSYFKINCDEESVDEYIMEGGSLDELLTILVRFNIKTQRGPCLIIFNAMHHVINKFRKDHYDRIDELVSSCKQLLVGYSKWLFTMLLPDKNVGTRKCALKLLTALANINDYFGEQILLNFEVSFDLCQSLAEHYRPDRLDTVRTAYIKFLLAFIVDRSPSILKKLIYKKGVLASIFPGLKHDPRPLLEHFLAVLQTNIVQNKDLSRNHKLVIFNTHNILHLVSVYSWNPYEMKTHYTEKKSITVSNAEVDPDDLDCIRSGVHKLLMQLLTCSKLGVVFQDPSYGTSSKKFCNTLLSTIMQGLIQPWEDPLQCELMSKVFRVSPDVFGYVFAQLFEPYIQTPNKFVKVVTFVRKVIKDMTLVGTKVELRGCVRLAQRVLLPQCLVTAITDEMTVLSSDAKTRSTALKTIIVCLKQFLTFTNSVRSTHPDITLYISVMTQYFIKNFGESYNLFQLLSNACQELDAKTYCRIVTALLLYERVCPQLMDSLRYKSEKLDVLYNMVKGLIKSCSDDTQECVVLRTVQLSLIIFPPDASTSTMEALCDRVRMMCTALSRSKGPSKETLNVLKDLLEGTGMFSSCQQELTLWVVHGLATCPGVASSLVMRATQSALDNLPNLYAIINKADNAVDNTEPTERLSNFTLDDFIKLSIKETRPSAKLSGGAYCGLNVSPFLVAVLQIVEAEESTTFVDSEVLDYVRTVLVHLFHTQASPEGYMSLLGMFKCDTVSSVLGYVESWCRREDSAAEPALLDVEPFTDGVHHLISRCLIAEDIEPDEVIAQLECEEELSQELCFQQIVFTVCQLSNLRLVTSSRIHRASELTLALVQPCSGAASAAHNALAHHPVLLGAFHPFRTAKHFNLTKFIIAVVEGIQPGPEVIEQYLNRLVFQLKCAMEKKNEIKGGNMKKILETFPLRAQDVKDIILQMLQFDYSRLMGSESGCYSNWMQLEIELLNIASVLKIQLETDQLVLLCNQLIHLASNGVNISPLAPAILKHFKTYPEKLYADSDPLQQCFGELIVALDDWNDWCWLVTQLSSDIARLQVAEIWDSNSGGETKLLAIILLASSASPLPGSLVSLIDDLVASTSFVALIFKVLTSAPAWAKNISNLLPFLPEEKCKEIFKCAEEQKQKMIINSTNMEFLEGVFTRISDSNTLIHLIEHWLLKALKNDDCGQSIEVLVASLIRCNEKLSRKCRIKCEDGGEDVEMTLAGCRLSNELVRLLVQKGLHQSLPLCLFAVSEFSKADSVEPSPDTIFGLVTSHPNYQATAISDGRLKFEMFKLMLQMITKDNTLMKCEDVPTLLSAYGASMSSSDRVILQVLQKYEEKGVWLKRDACTSTGWLYLWGETAQRQYAFSKKSSGTTHKKQVFVTDSGISPLDLLDITVVHNTITNFPIRRKLRDNTEVFYCEGDAGFDVYDPSFILSVLCHVIEHSNIGANSRRLINTGVLSIVLCSLSSEDPRVRGAAFYMLHTISGLLFDTRENLLLVHFMDALRSGIQAMYPPVENGHKSSSDSEDSADIQLSSILTVFLARSLLILHDSLHPMYKPIIGYFLAKPKLAINSVPAFLELFNSTHLDRSVHQEWILKVLKDGIRQASDMRLALNCYVFKIMLDFHSSSLASDGIKTIIEDIVKKCVFEIDTSQKLLLKEYSVLAWVSHNITSSEPRMMSIIRMLAPQTSEPTSTPFGLAYNALCRHITAKKDRLCPKPIST